MGALQQAETGGDRQRNSDNDVTSLEETGENEKMTAWLDLNPKASEEEILEKSREIAHEK